MRATQTRLVIIALLSLSLGACGSIFSKRASAPHKNGATSSPEAAEAAPAAAGSSADSEAIELEESAPLAKPSVVVLVKGARSARVRKMVENTLARSYDLVPGKRYHRTARRLKARRMKTRHIARVAKRLGADAVLHGTLVRKGKRYKLRMHLRDGSTGKTLERFTLTLRSRQLRKRDRRALAARVRPVLDEMAPAQVATSRPGPKAAGRQRVADATPEVDNSPALVERVDTNGQVIDEEVPDILR